MISARHRLQPLADGLFRYSIYAVFSILALLFFRYQHALLDYREWSDESETIVAVQMMGAGSRLYSQVFSQHGPLTFLPGLVVQALGGVNVWPFRIPVAALQLLALLCIATSPSIGQGALRVLAAAVSGVVVVVFLPEIYGHMYLYQALAGVLITIIISQYTIPAIIGPAFLGRARVFAGCCLLVCLVFLAITYLPVAGLLFLASLRREYLREAAAGVLAGLVFNLAFLGIFGSFAGYLSFHIYLNAEILPAYTGLQPGWQLLLTSLTTAVSDMPHLLAVSVIMAAATVLAAREGRFAWRSMLLVAGIFSLLMRGGGFQGMPFFYATLAMVAPLVGLMDVTSRQARLVGVALLVLFICKLSLLMPGDSEGLAAGRIPPETAFSRLARSLTGPDDRIIAYSFQNYQYIAARRLPASGYYFYLPWQADYNKAPRYGIRIDPCEDIRTAAPKVMLIDKWKVWDRFPWMSYATCVQDIIDTSYVQVPGRPFYVRRDLVARFPSAAPRPGPWTMVPSAPLGLGAPIALAPVAGLPALTAGRQLTDMFIMFGTHVRINPGTAALELTRQDGSLVRIGISLPDLVDNAYARLAIPPGAYAAARIVPLTGGGVSVWESRNAAGEAVSCLQFGFSDGTRGFTPGCPWM